MNRGCKKETRIAVAMPWDSLYTNRPKLATSYKLWNLWLLIQSLPLWGWDLSSWCFNCQDRSSANLLLDLTWWRWPFQLPETSPGPRWWGTTPAPPCTSWWRPAGSYPTSITTTGSTRGHFKTAETPHSSALCWTWPTSPSLPGSTPPCPW